MIPELGHFALILALVVALLQGTLPLVGASHGDRRLMGFGDVAALTQALLVATARAVAGTLLTAGNNHLSSDYPWGAVARAWRPLATPSVL